MPSIGRANCGKQHTTDISHDHYKHGCQASLKLKLASMVKNKNISEEFLFKFNFKSLNQPKPKEKIIKLKRKQTNNIIHLRPLSNSNIYFN